MKMNALGVCLLFASPVLALPDAPIPKVAALPMGYAIIYGKPRPVVRENWMLRPETLAAFQGLAALADGITTGQMPHKYVELDPITRPLIGLHPSYVRMVPLGVAEVGVSYLIARRWPKMRWLQVGLTVSHAACAGHNLTLH